MIDEALILTLQRLRDDLGNFRFELRSRYSDPKRQVTASDLKEVAARMAETWMVRVAQVPDVKFAIDSNYLADLNVHFQRILTFSEKASTRARYDLEIKSILRDFTIKLVIPLKQLRQEPAIPPSRSGATGQLLASPTILSDWKPTAFLGHSFSSSDASIVACVRGVLEVIGIIVTTGEKPKADRVSEKVKTRIDAQFHFVGLFTRRDKLEGRNEWTTSPWLIDEKAYAVGKGKKLILLKEDGVTSIGGIQGDYEYVEFSRTKLEELVLRILEFFDVGAVGLRS